MALIVKNTFICFVDDGDDVALGGAERSMGRKRSSTDSEALTAVTGTLSIKSIVTDDLLSDCESFAEAVSSPSPVATPTKPPLNTKRPLAAARIFDVAGASMVLELLQEAGPQEALELVSALRGFVLQAARSAHAGAILTEAISRLGTEDAAFIPQELLPSAYLTALNIHGSAVLCRLLEYSPEHPDTAALLDEVLAGDLPALCLHKFGHTVAMSVLSSGLERHRAAIVAALRTDLPRFARHRFGTQVLVEALEQTDVASCAELAGELLQKPTTVLSLACHGFGVQVVRSLLDSAAYRDQVVQYLLRCTRRVMKDRYGADLMRELGLAGAAVTAVGPTTVELENLV